MRFQRLTHPGADAIIEASHASGRIFYVEVLQTSMSLTVGEIVEGTVTGITNFGAFVELPDGRTGLVHISEVADDYVESVRDYVQMNDKVKVKILSVDEPGNKIRLSIRQAQPDWDPSKSQRPRRRERRGSSSFEDMLQKFIKDSD